MFPILYLGPLALPVAPFVFLLGAWFGAALVERRAARLGLERDIVSNMLYIGFGAALVGARLGYVALHFDAFAHDPLAIVMPTPATLDMGWGVACGMSAGAFYGWKNKLPLWRTLDALAPGIPALALTLGLAHWANGDAFGAPARLPWSVYLWEEYRHPSQLYEIAAALVLFLVWRFSRAYKLFDGFQFLVVAALYATSVIFLEAFRGDSGLFQGWRVAQLVALAALALALAAMRWQSRRAVMQKTAPAADE